jgi:hypothetical protein
LWQAEDWSTRSDNHQRTCFQCDNLRKRVGATAGDVTLSRLISERGESVAGERAIERYQFRPRVRLPLMPGLVPSITYQTGDVSLQRGPLGLSPAATARANRYPHRQRQSFGQHGIAPRLLRGPIVNKGLGLSDTFRKAWIARRRHTVC